jgi:hypothetical protein
MGSPSQRLLKAGMPEDIAGTLIWHPHLDEKLSGVGVPIERHLTCTSFRPHPIEANQFPRFVAGCS